MKRGLGIFALVLVGATPPASASELHSWHDPHDLPLAASVRSAVVQQHDAPIQEAPDAKSRRRGSALGGALLPVYGATPGPGCDGRWLQIGPLAWICQDAVTLSSLEPVDRDDRSHVIAEHGLPYRYFFVGKDGSWAYGSLRDADEAVPEQQLEPGFAVAGVDLKTKGIERYVLTSHNRWVPLRDLSGPARPFLFQGQSVEDGRLDFAWVVVDNARIYSRPDLTARTKATRSRFELVPVLETKQSRGERFVRIDEQSWLRARDLRQPTSAPPPDEILPGERWIDIELATQTLVLYEGDRPIFATLVSTGRGAQGTERATPKGVHRIWVKLRTTNMSNLSDEDATRLYAIEDVPYVQFFSKGVGLHAAFWHRSFGFEKSQGCVNLAPLDAQKLFELTSPRLPAGWHAALPTSLEEGTVVRVR